MKVKKVNGIYYHLMFESLIQPLKIKKKNAMASLVDKHFSLHSFFKSHKEGLKPMKIVQKQKKKNKTLTAVSLSSADLGIPVCP